ncbi:MAG: twin-arginine translocase subunit TatB [Alphaproteobacteria bacterium]|nr:twin-arginine translocase subunit TatB [Alphaproteobacteria bacterium]
MFDFAWSEIALIGVVALVLIGPKDMPVAVKAVTGFIKKARRMASEFQSHVDEMVRDTELADVRQQINEIRNFDIRGEFERAVDADGSLRRSFEDPLVTPAPVSPAGLTVVPAAEPGSEAGPAEATVAEAPGTIEVPEVAAAEPGADADAAGEPEFIPPAIAAAPEPPDFIPPRTARPR